MEFSMGGSTYVVPTPHQDHNKLNCSYKEILKLNIMLDNAKIPHTMRRLDDGWQVIYTPYHPDSWVARMLLRLVIAMAWTMTCSNLRGDS